MSAYNHPISASMLVQIGDMTVSFGHLEFHMQQVLIYLLDQSAIIGRVLASYLPFTRLRAALSTLYEERFDADTLFLELKDLLKEAASIEQERNAITHSSWLAGNSPLTITRHKVTGHEKSGFRAQFEQYSEQRLVEFNERIKDLIGKFMDFYKNLPDKIPDSTA